MSSLQTPIASMWAKADRSAVRAFFLAMAALSVALLLALYSGAAGELGHFGLSVASSPTALLVAAWVARDSGSSSRQAHAAALARLPHGVQDHPRRLDLHRRNLVVALAALNTGNNLLFLILASLIAIILMSGILSSITLTGMRCAWTARTYFRRPAGPRARSSWKTKS